MNSDDLDSQGVNGWLDFRQEARDDFLASVPEEPGVYAIRRPHRFGRYEGESDIVYIGSAEGSLRRRFRSYFRPGSSQATSQRINTEMRGKSDLQLGFFALDPAEDVRTKERELLVAYKRDHRELPPLNRAMPGESED